MAYETARVIPQTKPTPHESTGGVMLLGVIRELRLVLRPRGTTI
jgi:hypothetical protein